MHTFPSYIAFLVNAVRIETYVLIRLRVIHETCESAAKKEEREARARLSLCVHEAIRKYPKVPVMALILHTHTHSQSEPLEEAEKIEKEEPTHITYIISGKVFLISAELFILFFSHAVPMLFQCM